MNILLTADIHGSYIAVEKLRMIGKCFDLTIVCGDITPKIVEYGEDLRKVQKEWFENVFLPLMDEIDGYFILGNDDLFDYKSERMLSGNMKLKGLNILAYDKVPPTSFGTYREVSDEVIWADLRDVNVEKPFVFITHAPPHGILDSARGRNFGSVSLKNFVFWKKPILHCFGHIHESFGDIQNEHTVFVNAAFEEEQRFYVVSINGNSHVKVFEL
ncbi:metallophosphoesterase family protein [Thermosipho atlanticus]|uniref:Predicted phosphoesterase n=1 Tax=Thermosipho atlanticus DSM 15807 TaxID=1123380 RepID=A0A1M5R5D9_9BACT|nr:metallophosphoesterase [Thermosipho atlanticus]SHH21552.1 Predicted phosphoesterase [Thermosipho atlanticus DSM 15807]